MDLKIGVPKKEKKTVPQFALFESGEIKVGYKAKTRHLL